MINLTAQGSGYYIVSVNGVDTTQHVTEREAIESAVNQEQDNPSAVVEYRHDYIVRVEEHAAPPEPTPEPIPDPAPAPQPGNFLFQDTFDYVVDRNTAGAEAIFRQHGWNGAKTQQDTTRSPRGYIYTVDAVPGYTGPLPARGRALCLEALPATLNGQTDFYLEYGDGENAAFDNFIPSNVWFKFWLYVNHTAEQPSAMTFEKFLYACNGAYPCHLYNWMFSLETLSADPHWVDIDGSRGDCHISLSAPYNPVSPVTNPASTNPGYEWRMGQSNLAERVRPNRWQEITLHMDTSGPLGIWEAWIQPLGGEKIKVADFVSGQNGFEWRVEHPGLGHRTFRMPTTVGSTSGGPDNWMYIQDFRVSPTEI